MTTPRELLDKVKLRAWALVIASNGDIDYRDAERAAAKEVAAAERERKRRSVGASAAAAPSLEGVTPSNARKWLYDKLAEIALRLKAHIVEDEPPPVIRKHTQDEIASPSSKDEPAAAPIPPSKQEPEPPVDQLIGGFAFGASTSERIPDEQYHTSVQSPVTQSWRQSIEANERRAEARKRGWIG
jgi:hypothetical protein